VYFADRAEQAEKSALDALTPSSEDPDPSLRIPGVQVIEFKSRTHVDSDERVAYSQSPPTGGNHDSVWATCTGHP
jgi:hypothetical protein